MESNSAKKESARSITETYAEAPHLSIPTLECQSEFMKNLKRNQIQQSSYEPTKISSPPVIQPLSAPPPMQSYMAQPPPFSFISEGAEELNEALNQLVSQDPKFLNNPALVNTLKILELATIVNKQGGTTKMNEMPAYGQLQMPPNYSYPTQAQNWIPQSTINQNLIAYPNMSMQAFPYQSIPSQANYQTFEGSPHASLNQSIKQSISDTRPFYGDQKDTMYNYEAEAKDYMNDMSMQFDTESEMSYRIQPEASINTKQSPPGCMYNDNSSWQSNIPYMQNPTIMNQNLNMMQQNPSMMNQNTAIIGKPPSMVRQNPSMVQQSLQYNPLLYQPQSQTLLPQNIIMMANPESSNSNYSGMNQTFGGFQKYSSPKPTYQHPFADQKANAPISIQSSEKKSPPVDDSYLKFYKMQQQMNENENLNLDPDTQLQNNSFNPYIRFTPQNKEFENNLDSNLYLNQETPYIETENKMPEEMKEIEKNPIRDKKIEKPIEAKPETMQFDFTNNTKRASDYDEKPIRPMKNNYSIAKEEFPEENNETQNQLNKNDNVKDIQYDDRPLPAQSVKKNPYDEKPIGGKILRGNEEDIPLSSKPYNFEKLLESELKKNPDAVVEEETTEQYDAPKEKREFLKRK